MYCSNGWANRSTVRNQEIFAMMSLRTKFFAAALVAAPLALTGAAVQAATVTGSVTYASTAGVYATLDATTGAWSLVATGSFSASGGFSSYLDSADDWEVTGVLASPLTGMVVETETWGAPISAFGLMVANTPYSPKFLFTLFTNAMALGEQAVAAHYAGDDFEGEYTVGGGWGLLPAGDKFVWAFSDIEDNSTGIGPGQVDITGNFVFTLSGDDAAASFASASNFLLGTPLPLEFLGGLPTGVVPVSLSLTLAPVTHDTPMPIPLPAALPLLAGGLGLMGLMGWRRRRA
jgi:hypothetical protein